MGPGTHQEMIILSLVFLISSSPAQSICVPKNTAHVSTPSSPSPFTQPPSPSPFSPVDPPQSPWQLPQSPSPSPSSSPVDPSPSSMEAMNVGLPTPESPDSSTAMLGGGSIQDLHGIGGLAKKAEHLAGKGVEPAIEHLAGKLMEHEINNMEGKAVDVGKAVDPGIKKVCDATDHPDLCLSAIIPFLEPGKNDARSVLEWAIKACLGHSKEAISTSTKLASAPAPSADSSESAPSSAVEVCKESYSDALDNLEAALESIDSGDMGTVSSNLSAAIADFSSCEDAFMGSEASPYISLAGSLIKLTGNCLAIAALL